MIRIDIPFFTQGNAQNSAMVIWADKWEKDFIFGMLQKVSVYFFVKAHSESFINHYYSFS